MLEVFMVGASTWFGVVLMLFVVSASVSANIIAVSATSGQLEVEFRDMPARFGGIVPPEGMIAMLVYADPPDGCGILQPPPKDVPNITNYMWAVLIKRGNNCTFGKKVRNAQDASYDIAIVHNVGSNELEPMSAEDPRGIEIPAVFVGANTGQLLKENYLYNCSYFIEINNDYPFLVNNLLWPFAIVVGLCFFLMLGFMVGVVVKCIKDRRRARRHRLPASSLKKIPTTKFHKGDPYETCAICLDDYVEGDKLRVLPCSHAYHSKCIDPWLTRNRRVCPVCKRKVFAADEVPHSHSTWLSDNSDSESDNYMDDTTPLIRPNGLQTNGGTFNNQLENPLNRSHRPFAERRNSTSSASTNSDGAPPTFFISNDRPFPRVYASQSPHDADGEEEEEEVENGVESSSVVRVARSGGRRANQRRQVSTLPAVVINAPGEDVVDEENPGVSPGTSGNEQDQSSNRGLVASIRSYLLI